MKHGNDFNPARQKTNTQCRIRLNKTARFYVPVETKKPGES